MYAIICSSRTDREKGVTSLALVDRAKTRARWWTPDTADEIKGFPDEAEAKDRLCQLEKNNPRVIPYAEACRIITEQALRVEAVTAV